MEYTVKTLAELAGVTPRTLRWYDQKGLLKPRRTTEAGYRLYGPEEVNRLQAILFYKELGLELEAVREILDAPGFDRLAALQSHLAELEARRRRLDALILTVEKTIGEAKGGTQMSDKEKFEAFKRRAVEANEEQYGKEIREQYGPEAVEESNARLLSMTEEEHGRWKALEAEILSALAAAVRAGRPRRARRGGALRSSTAAGCAAPGPSTPPRPTGVWRSCIRRTNASPPIMTRRSPAAPRSCGMRSGPIRSEQRARRKGGPFRLFRWRQNNFVPPQTFRPPFPSILQTPPKFRRRTGRREPFQKGASM